MLLFTPPALAGGTLYEPAPKPVSVYCPAAGPGGPVVVVTVGEPTPVITALETNRIPGGIALPYVTVPLIEAPGVSAQLRKRTEMLEEPLLTDARSCSPFPSKSPTSIDNGLTPTPRSIGAPKLPMPSPNRSDTVPESRFATARSCSPFPSKSPTSIDNGLTPTPRSIGSLKPPAPSPSKIEMFPDVSFATAIS